MGEESVYEVGGWYAWYVSIERRKVEAGMQAPKYCSWVC
jgi:hypothetical protein